MSLDDAQMAHLLQLARLELSPAETAAIEADLNEVLAYVDLLRELDTDDVEPLTRPITLTDAFRPDEETPSLPPERVEALAVAMEGGRIRVPRTVDEGN